MGQNILVCSCWRSTVPQETFAAGVQQTLASTISSFRDVGTLCSPETTWMLCQPRVTLCCKSTVGRLWWGFPDPTCLCQLEANCPQDMDCSNSRVDMVVHGHRYMNELNWEEKNDREERIEAFLNSAHFLELSLKYLWPCLFVFPFP